MYESSPFEDIFHADAKARMWQEISARKLRVRTEARKAFSEAYSAMFRQRAKELGGVTQKTRALIHDESVAWAKRAQINVYLKNGYTECTGETTVFYPDENVWMPEKCNALVSPGFAFCPDHTPISA